MRRPLPPMVSADRIRLALTEARPSGLVMTQLVAATELSPAQVRRGLAHLRDIAAAEGLPPLIWTSLDGYQFSGDPDALEAYELAVFRRKLTEIARLITGTIAPHATLFPDDDWVRLIKDQLNGAKATFEALSRSRR